MIPSIAHRPFGVLPNGASVEAWTLSGADSLQVEIITYGAIVTRLLAPDRQGRPGGCSSRLATSPSTREAVCVLLDNALQEVRGVPLNPSLIA